MKINIYVVSVKSKDFPRAYHVLQEAYRTLKAAQDFINGRADDIEKLNDYCYEGKDYYYCINICELETNGG